MPEIVESLRLRGSLRIVVERANGRAEETFARNVICLIGRSNLLQQIMTTGVAGPADFAFLGFGSGTNTPTVTDTGLTSGFYGGVQLAINYVSYGTSGLLSNPPFISVAYQLTGQNTFIYSYPLFIAEAAISHYGSAGAQIFAHVTFPVTQIHSNDTVNVTWTISG